MYVFERQTAAFGSFYVKTNVRVRPLESPHTLKTSGVTDVAIFCLANG